MSAAAVSQNISKLERRFDCQLLVRDSRNFWLTDAGESLISSAQLMVDQFERSCDVLAGTAKNEKAVSKIALSHSPLDIFWIEAIKNTIGLHNPIFDLNFATDAELAKDLKSNFKISTRPDYKKSYKTDLILQLEVGLYSQAKSDLALNDLEAQLQTYVASPCEVRSSIYASEKFLELQKAAHLSRIQVDSLSVALDVVCRGLGCAAMPVAFAKERVLAGEILQVFTEVTLPYFEIYCHELRGLDGSIGKLTFADLLADYFNKKFS